jgi:protocatechuate 3,4-dioxygenase beta subunit
MADDKTPKEVKDEAARERTERAAANADAKPANEQPQNPLDESPPKAEKGVAKSPKATGEALRASGSGPNMMQTDQLSPLQRARVEGTVIDGANGAAVTGAPATEPVDDED